MDLFDSYKNEWQKQKAGDELDSSANIEKAKISLQKHHRKTIFTNIFVTLSFLAVFVVIGWIWTSMEARASLFYISLTFMVILLVTTMIGFWAGVHFKNEDSYISTKDYVHDRLKKLRWQKWMLIKFTPVYLILLTLIFYLYIADITTGGSLSFIFGAYGMVTAFIGLTYLLNLKKRKRNVERMDKLISELEEWLEILG